MSMRLPSNEELRTINQYLAEFGLHLYECAGVTIFPAYNKNCELLCAQMFVLFGGTHALGVRYTDDLFTAVKKAVDLFGEHSRVTPEGSRFPVVTL